MLMTVSPSDLTTELRHDVDSHATALATAISSQGSELSLQMASLGPSITHALDQGLNQLEESIGKQFKGLEQQWADLQQDRVIHQSAPSMNVAQKKAAMQPERESVALFDSLCSCRINCPQKHEKGCFRSFQHKKVHIIAGKFRIFSSLLHFRLEVQRAPFAFARDLRVYPNFSMRSTVPGDSGAFSLVHETFLAMERGLAAPELQTTFRDCLVKLRTLFEEGKAWPTDVTTRGESLLHVSLFSPQSSSQTAGAYKTTDRKLGKPSAFC